MQATAARGVSSQRALDAAYLELRRAVINAGLLERAYGYYLWRGLVSYAVLVAGLLLALRLPATPLATLLSAVVIAAGLVQVAFLGHDAGHLAVFRGARANQIFGSLCWSLT